MAGEAVKKFIGQWLGTISPKEFNNMAETDKSLVILLKPYEQTVKMAKIFTSDFKIAADELLAWMIDVYPSHGMIAYSNRDWFNRNIDELTRYIESV